MHYDNDKVYATSLAPEGEPVGVIGRAGPAVLLGVGICLKGEWKVQWWEPPVEDGFRPLSFYIENMGEPEVVGFTPLMPPMGFKAKEAA